jgi:transcriptional regulator with XRE-family HTH domain
MTVDTETGLKKLSKIRLEGVTDVNGAIKGSRPLHRVYSRIERGVESPSVDNPLKIARALGVRGRDLVDGF